MPLLQSDFEHLLQLRTGLRRFLRWSEQEANAAGLTPRQHQLLLAIQGHPGPDAPTVGDVARYLVLRHHSTVELIDRAAAVGLVTREGDANNNSVVRLALTAQGAEKLDALTETHLKELRHLAPAMRSLWQALEDDGSDGASSAHDRPTIKEHP